MKKFYLVLLALVLVMSSCTESNSPKIEKIRVGVFDGYGGSEMSIWETIEAIRIDSLMEVTKITAGDIAAGKLQEYDALVIPGGSGKRQFMNLGEENHKRIKDFVAGGKGIVGICAGSYFLSSTPNYKCMDMNGAMAIDIAHDNRGHGIAKFSLSEEGKNIFPELAGREINYVMYFEGPVYTKNEDSEIKHTVFGTMESDIHLESNAPKNLTNGKPIFIGNTYGKGKVFSCVVHPEGTAGMIWIVPRMVRWTLDLPLIKYTDAAVNPDVFGKEILMTKELRDKEATALDIFLYGSVQEKVNIMDWLQSVNGWETKRMIQGLLFSPDAEVRARAAEYIAGIDFLWYLNDLKTVYANEKDADAKARIGKAVQKLESLKLK